MKTYITDPLVGCQTIRSLKLHTNASAIITATDILINAANDVECTGKTVIMLSTPLYRELLATLRGVAHDINPPGVQLRSSHTADSPENHRDG